MDETTFYKWILIINELYAPLLRKHLRFTPVDWEQRLRGHNIMCATAKTDTIEWYHARPGRPKA